MTSEPAPTEQAEELPGRPATVAVLRAGHLPVLDGIRGLAILMVLFAHFLEADGARTDLPQWLHGCIEGLRRPGRLGVDLFFVLSGFLITGIVLDNRGKSGFLYRFYVRRSLRIFPLYYLALAIGFYLLPWAGWGEVPSLADQLWLSLYGTNVAATFWGVWFGHLHHFWSLAVEEHFYIFWPALVLLTPRRWLAAVCGALVVVSVVSRVVIGWKGYSTYYFTPCRMDALVLGGWLALAMRSERGMAVVQRMVRPMWLVGIGVAFAVMYAAARRVGNEQVIDSVRFLGAPLVFAALLARAVIGGGGVVVGGASVLARVLCWKPLALLGLYSYGLYVYHNMLRVFFEPWFASDRFSPYVGQAGGVALKVVVCSVLSLAVAVLSYQLIEKPLLGLKRFFEYGGAKGGG